ALDDAWGTEEATQARKASLEEAGAVDKPPPPPVGLFGWLRRGFYAACIVGAAGFVFVLGGKLGENNKEITALAEAKSIAKKVEKPLLQSQLKRAIGLLYLHARKGNVKAAHYSFGDALPAAEFADRDKAIHDQLLLIDVAL